MVPSPAGCERRRRDLRFRPGNRLADRRLDATTVFEHDVEPAERRDGIRLFPLYEDPVRGCCRPAISWRTGPRSRPVELTAESWIRPYEGGLRPLVGMLASESGPEPRLLDAGQGEEPVESQALVVAGARITVAHELNVLTDPEHTVAGATGGTAPGATHPGRHRGGQRQPDGTGRRAGAAAGHRPRRRLLAWNGMRRKRKRQHTCVCWRLR